MDKIENGLTDDEIKLCFRRFDLNDDGHINFEEFYRTLCKINGEPSFVGKFLVTDSGKDSNKESIK
jgi:Ca2+-binding EF-hand superfamily protein